MGHGVRGRLALAACLLAACLLAIGCDGDEPAAPPDASMDQAPDAAQQALDAGLDPLLDASLDAAPTAHDAGCPADAACDEFAALDRDGPHASATLTLAPTADSGGATVYYPTDATPPFAYAVFCPPYKNGREVTAAWGPYFASHGIVLATMDAAALDDYPPRRALGLAQMVDALRGENARADSPLYGKLDEARVGVLGWSMGGGAALSAVGAHPEWKSAILLAPHIVTATGYEASAMKSTVPMLVLNGALDESVLGGLGQSEAAYAGVPASTPKLLYVHAQLGHFEWGSPAAGGGAAGRYVMAWEKTFLLGDTRFAPILKVRAPEAAAFQSNL